MLFFFFFSRVKYSNILVSSYFNPLISIFSSSLAKYSSVFIRIIYYNNYVVFFSSLDTKVSIRSYVICGIIFILSSCDVSTFFKFMEEKTKSLGLTPLYVHHLWYYLILSSFQFIFKHFSIFTRGKIRNILP